MFRIALLILFSSVFHSAYSQHVELHWYNLKALQPLNEGDGKNVVTLLSEIVDDSLLTYNSKSQMFQLATKTSLDGVAWVEELNSHGYFIADITGSLAHQQSAVKSGYNFQVALLFFYNQTQFVQNGFTSILLNATEIELLQEEYLIDPTQFPGFILDENE